MVVLVMVVVSMRVRQMLAYHRRLTEGQERRDSVLARHVRTRPAHLATLSPQQVLISKPLLPHLIQ
jgi:hypothetical protein